jgi:acetate CoA/acetoacetate CoA-transferase alpha subunit
MKRAIKAEEAAAMIPDGAVLLVGGFMGVGSPHRLIDALVERGTRGLTIVANDTALPGRGIGKLISCGAVSRVIVSHIGLNPETQAKMMSGEITAELVPQGTLVERIRAGGVGLGGDSPSRHGERQTREREGGTRLAEIEELFGAAT